ncbi:MAG TPA: histidine ammonia-lyase [Candidatus Caenarcaniphilales bacterium]|nr:histidine ammonia-lyase [Candidatus Caenarcaniphilales bacterium]
MREPVELTGLDLTLEEVERVARHGAAAVLHPAARERMAASRTTIDELVDCGETVYGVTTGFGDLAGRRVAPADARRLQENLLVSHAVGVGPPHDVETVRAMLLLRANTLARGHSGCRPALVERLLDFLRLGIHPVVPEQGSVGASGDLAPLAHLALPLLGRGWADVDGERLEGAEALRRHGLEQLGLEAKEGLALLNGTQQMTAIGALLLQDAERLLATANVAAAMTVEALLGTEVAYAEPYHAARPHAGQARVAAELRHLLRDSQLQRSHHGVAHKIQDPYSIRCVPQVHGATADALEYARRVIAVEINSATDNPLVFPDGSGVDPGAVATGGGRVVSGGNFHGQPVALAMDFAAIGIAELGSISERRIAQLIDGRASGLPAFLVEEAGLNSGMMLYQYTAAALVSENKVLAHPASVDSIPTSANQEDHVSMGPIAARQARDVLRNVERVIALELLCAAQGLDFRLEDGAHPGAGVAAAHAALRERVDHLRADRDPGPNIAVALELVRSGSLAGLPAGVSTRSA